jgi:histidyl-tRNA synthetase
MRDFLPADKARRERLLGVIRSTYRAHGFDEIETPVMEDSSRLHAGLGGDNEKLAFAVLKRGLTADNFAAATDALDLADLGLRFDLTVPLARFYASHRSELPSVFRSIQIAPVWRAERPQKGRYRQFVQCDIDIIGESGVLAEVELLAATSAALAALGLDGCTIRINDRRLLLGMLDVLGFAVADYDQVLITIDKLDKVGPTGVIAELRERTSTPAAVDALEEFFARPLAEPLPFGIEGITAALPVGVNPEVIADLASLGDAVSASRAAEAADLAELFSADASDAAAPAIVFDPFLVRGMGYYTGPIFEITHPSVGYSLGGGGRYDGMIGRFLGSDVPATGFSLGFERLVDLVELPDDAAASSLALVYDPDVDPVVLASLKSSIITEGLRVRPVRRIKNIKLLLESLAGEGFSHYAFVGTDIREVTDLERRPLGA